MTTAAHDVATGLLLVVGVAVIMLTLSSAIRSTVLPRGVQDRLSRVTTMAVRATFRLRAGRSASYERRDRIMALLGPVSLLALLGSWITLLVGAYTLLYLATATSSLSRAIELSGSSIFTLGTTTASGLGVNLLTYSEAGFGLLLLTLLITYFPSIYSAFSRRERGVSLLRVRAGEPPRAATMMVRYHRIEDTHYRLAELWESWESWFVDVEESHTSFPVLAFFRSPQPEQSWVSAAGVLLDAASMWVAAIDHPSDPAAQLCIRAGFQALRRIASLFGLSYDSDPYPGQPVTVSKQEFEAALDEMESAGVPLKADRDQAWKDWAGWRVNYDTALLGLARLVEAPPAPWVSDRSPLVLGRAGSGGDRRRRIAFTHRRGQQRTTRSQ